MTEEQKEILIAKLLDCPSSLSDEELDLILHDGELREIYDASVAMSGALVRQPDFDMEEEWRRFRPRLRRKPTRMRWVMRVAAIFLGVVLASGIVVKIIDRAYTYDRQHVIAVVQYPDELKNPPLIQQAMETEDNAPIEQPAHQPKSESPKRNKAVTQEQSEDEIDEYLRIQQARIDNDLAIMVAESYIEEFDDLVEILDEAGAYNPEYDNMLRKVTIE